jgi:hypothetical protein
VQEKDYMVHLYMSAQDTAVASNIAKLGLPPAKRKVLRAVIDGILTDAFYTVLLALDGEASLGGTQMPYSLRDESGKELAGGDLEGPAWEQFHGPRSRRARRPSAESRRRKASAGGRSGGRRRRARRDA